MQVTKKWVKLQNIQYCLFYTSYCTKTLDYFALFNKAKTLIAYVYSFIYHVSKPIHFFLVCGTFLFYLTCFTDSEETQATQVY